MVPILRQVRAGARQTTAAGASATTRGLGQRGPSVSLAGGFGFVGLADLAKSVSHALGGQIGKRSVSLEQQKQRAALAAVEYLPPRGIVGLGTGSTAKFFIEAVAALVAEGRDLVGVATSEVSRRQAQQLGIPVLADEGPWAVDVCVDGADEVSSNLDLIKGGGGCHVREKIVNWASKRNVIVVDESKISEHLGEKWPVPLEILRFGRGSIEAQLGVWGKVKPRRRSDGSEWLTDSGNCLVDLHCGVVKQPQALEQQLLSVPGVVGTGLFLGRADVVIVAGEQGIRKLGAQVSLSD